MRGYTGIAVVLACLLLMAGTASGAAAGSDIEPVLDPHDTAGEDTDYIVRDPIAIDGDEDFARQAAAEGWPGDGSEDNPYVIEGYEIDGSEKRYGIRIHNTTAYFVVTGCYLHSAKGELDFWIPGGDVGYLVPGPGLYLVNVRNGKLENNVIANNEGAGIDVRISDSNIISNNIVYSNGGHSGIYLHLSDNNIISNNNVYSNVRRGISLSHSHGNIVENSTIADHRTGIQNWYSRGNTFVDNTFSDNERDFYETGDIPNGWWERIGAPVVSWTALILAAIAVIRFVIRRKRRKEAKG